LKESREEDSTELPAQGSVYKSYNAACGLVITSVAVYVTQMFGLGDGPFDRLKTWNAKALHPPPRVLQHNSAQSSAVATVPLAEFTFSILLRQAPRARGERTYAADVHVSAAAALQILLDATCCC